MTHPEKTSQTTRLPTYFISHGGGPWPYMDGEFRRNFDRLENSLHEMRATLGDAPRAVLMISGHWEERGLAISSGEHPGMVYDYQGFPEYLYRITYPAPGSPALARRVLTLLRANGLEARLDPTRGFDHGAFSIMKPLYPDARMPLVQLSLDASLDPELHIRVGRALAPLRDEGILIIGSGLSYHNLRAMNTPAGFAVAREFDAWLRQTLLERTPEHRTRALVEWEKAPAARAAHPREDHLLPLMVAVGAAESETAALVYHQTDFFGGLTVSSFRFGPPPHKPAHTEDVQPAAVTHH